MAKLSPSDIQPFLNDKLAEGLSPRTVRYLHAVLRRALGQALKRGLVPRNVATLVNLPKAQRPEVEPFTPDQARSFLAAIHGDRLEALYSVALSVGLRQGEALGLRWEDVDLDTGTITVRKALQRLNGVFELVEPKTARSRRTIALPQTAVTALRVHRTRQLQERLLAGSKWCENGLVFTNTFGTPIDASNLIRHFHRALVAAGTPSKTLPRLAPYVCSHCCLRKASIRVSLDIFGHSQMKPDDGHCTAMSSPHCSVRQRARRTALVDPRTVNFPAIRWLSPWLSNGRRIQFELSLYQLEPIESVYATVSWKRT